MVKEQVRDKQELIEQFDSHMTAITEQHQTQVAEMQAVQDQLKIKLADFEAQIRERNVELEQTQDQAIGKDEQIMQLRMELEMRQQEISMDEERNHETKTLRRDFDRA